MIRHRQPISPIQMKRRRAAGRQIPLERRAHVVLRCGVGDDEDFVAGFESKRRVRHMWLSVR